MTVAIVSVGYDGTVDETQWANLIGKAGSSEYGVDLAGDFAVTPVAGAERTIRIAPGKAWGHGVLDVMDVEQTLQFALPASGDRYDMLVLRRDWQPPGGATVLAIVQGSASSVTLPARNTGALGILDDQPLALVRVSAGSTSVSVTADLRVWARNGGATAKHTHALQYLGALGATVEIGGVVWLRRNGATGPEWRDAAKLNDSGILTSGVPIVATTNATLIDYQVSRVGSFVTARADFTYRGPTMSGGAGTGNLPDTTIFTVGAGWRPAWATYNVAWTRPGTSQYFGRIDSGGAATVTHAIPGVPLRKGDGLRFDGSWVVG